MIKHRLVQRFDRFDLVAVYRNDEFLYKTAIQHAPPTLEQNIKFIESLGMNEENKRANNKERKFNEKQVIEIKKRIASGEQMKAIAKELGVGPSTIMNIKAGRTYKEVTS